MERGNISNQAAPALVLDMNLLFRPAPGLWNSVKRLVGLHPFEADPKGREAVNLAFRKGWIVYLVDRNQHAHEVRPEALVEDWEISAYRHIQSGGDLMEVVNPDNVLLAVFEESFTRKYKHLCPKMAPFTDWSDVEWVVNRKKLAMIFR